MKKCRYLIFLLILIFIPFISAQAKNLTGTVSKVHDPRANNPIYILVDGKYRHMQWESYTVTLNGQTNPAVCADPLKNSGLGKVTCTAINTKDSTTKAKTLWLLVHKGSTEITAGTPSVSGGKYVENHAFNGLVIQCAIRLAADTAGLSNGSATAKAIANGGLSESDPFTGTTDNARNVAHTHTKQVLKAAYAMYRDAGKIETAVSDGATDGDIDLGITFKKSDYGDGTYKITFKTTRKITGTLNFTCTHCTIQSTTINAKSGTLIVKPTKNCPSVTKYHINYTYRVDNCNTSSGTKYVLYHCTKGSSYQSFVTYTKKTTSSSGSCTDSGSSQNWTYDDCVECTVPTQYVTHSVKMCCTDSTTSWVKEPKINTLFCDRDYTYEKVKGYIAGKQAKSDYVKDDINEYCNLYCTEQVQTNIPGALSGKNGKYFRLSGSPTIKGKMTCRLLTNYTKWQKNYVSYTKQAINAYNSYQEYKALEDSYQKAKDYMDGLGYTNSSNTGTAYYSCTASNSNCDATCTASTSKSTTCTYKYKHTLNDIFNGNSYKYTYYTIKGEYNGSTDLSSYVYNTSTGVPAFNGLTIKYKGSSTKQGSNGPGKYDFQWTNGANCDSAASVSASCTCYHNYYTYAMVNNVNVATYHSDSYTATNSSCGRTSVSKTSEDGTSTFIGKLNSARSTANSYKNTYNGAVAKIKELETDLTKCNKYFTTSPGNDAATAFNMEEEPVITFNYFQVYVKSENKQVDALTNTDYYDVTCNYENAVVVTADNADLGLQARHYNTAGSNSQTANVNEYNFKNGAPICNDTSSYCNGNANTYNSNMHNYAHTQEYTTDAYYGYTCTGTSETQSLYTMYPYGSLGTEEDSYVTKHIGEHGIGYIEYSTFSTEFQTYWTLGELGSKGQFTEYYASKADTQTCSGEAATSLPDVGDDNAGLSCKLTTYSTVTKIGGCNTGGKSISINNYNSKCGTTYNGEDILTYSFRIVTSSKVFPACGDSTSDSTLDTCYNTNKYGYNWLKTTHGRTALRAIEAKGAIDDTYNTKNISYSFHLTTADIEAIKKYNDYQSNHDNGYADFEGYSCEAKGNTFVTCKAGNNSFLSNLASNKIKYGNTTYSSSSTMMITTLHNARGHVVFEDGSEVCSDEGC